MSAAGEVKAAAEVDPLEARCRALASRAGIDPDSRDASGMLGWVRFLEAALAEIAAERAETAPGGVSSAEPCNPPLPELQQQIMSIAPKLGMALATGALPQVYAIGASLREHIVQIFGSFEASDGETYSLALRMELCECANCQARRRKDV